MRNLRLWTLVLGVCAHVCVAGEPQTLQVVAFNVLFKGADDAKSVAVFDPPDADLVCLSELTPAFVTAFEKARSADYPYRAFFPQKGTWGIGLASKVPLTEVKLAPVAPSKIPAVEATFVRDGQRVRVVCVHLNPPVGKHRKSDGFFTTLEKNADVRRKQADTLVARYAKVKDPMILLGDFNEEPGGDAMEVLRKAGFARNCLGPDSWCQPTFPGPAVSWPAVFTIDHVLARGLTITATRTLKAGGSDHYPVEADLSLEP
ncbi:MAG: endonuclease/exonuclease/phosphatase family protein [Myxococcaceae bacterium]